MDRLGPDIFSTLQIKAHALHRARTHLKVPGWSLVWNEVLTKKLPLFWSRLNQINRDCEKLIPVSGSLWSILEWWILLRGCEGEMWGWMECYYYSPSETFVVLIADQFVERDDGLLEQLRQDSHVCRTWKSHISSDFKGKLESSLQRRRKSKETENKVWNSWHVMDVRMNTTNNYENLSVCSTLWYINLKLRTRNCSIRSDEELKGR